MKKELLNDQEIAGLVSNSIKLLGIKTLHDNVQSLLQKDTPDLWESANVIGAYYNNEVVDAHLKDELIKLISIIREHQGGKALISTRKTTVVFGTSGWRGLIGEDFTLLSVHKVVRGIIAMMKTTEFLKTCGYTSFAEVQKAGILLLRDNRYLGETFMEAAMKELAAEDIKIFSAGECPTGVGSAILTELKGAGSINFTPSHNPMGYAGIKFNPADGGPAEQNLTGIIEENSNNYTTFTVADHDYQALKTDINAKVMFREFIEHKSKVFDLTKLRNWLKNNKNDICIAIDFMHGSSRGYLTEVIDSDLMQELKNCNAVHFFNTDDDYSFHGVKPEPSAKNQAPLIEFIKHSGKKYTLAVALDPDADRIRFADSMMDIDMNLFSALAFNELLGKKKITGGIVSSAPSSDFALNIATEEGREVYETQVGFKNFRPALSSEQAIMGFEESDGITFTGHTLEKCAVAGFLMALEIISSKEKNLSTVYQELQQQYGYFYPGKAGTDVKGVTVEAWQDYKKKVVAILQNNLYQMGDSILVGDNEKEIIEINTIDGLKVIFTDKSWILLRPSGTEPKFRYYYEITSDIELDNRDEIIRNYCIAAEQILLKARKIAE